MHEEEQGNTPSNDSHSDYTSEKGHQDSHSNHKPKISPHKKFNDNHTLTKGSKTIAHQELAIITERRCTSAPGIVNDEQSSYEHAPEAGNLTAPSTPLPKVTRCHNNQTPEDTKRVITNNHKSRIQHNKKDLELELRGDSLGLLNAGNSMQEAGTKQHQQQSQHHQQQHHQQQHLHQQQLQQNHAQLQKLRSSIRDSSTSHSKQEKPKFEVRAVGFSLSPREKREDRNQNAVKSMDYSLKDDQDKKDPMLTDNEKVNKIKSEQSDITVRVPVIDNTDDGDNNEGKVVSNNNTTSLGQDLNANEIHESNEPTEATKAQQSSVDKKIPLEMSQTEQKLNEEEKVTSKKEKKKSHSKGRRNSKQHTKKK